MFKNIQSIIHKSKGVYMLHTNIGLYTLEKKDFIPSPAHIFIGHMIKWGDNVFTCICLFYCPSRSVCVFVTIICQQQMVICYQISMLFVLLYSGDHLPGNRPYSIDPKVDLYRSKPLDNVWERGGLH